MTRWCPRCDAVRDAQETCPSCGTPLADLSGARPRPAEAAAPTEPHPPPGPGPSRTRAALALAVVVLAGLAFLAGRAGGLDQGRGGSGTSAGATASSTPAKAPIGRRGLDWSARHGGTTVTAVAVQRVGNQGASQLELRIDGLARGQEVLGLGGLTLRDAQGGLFASPDETRMGLTSAVPVSTGRDHTYLVDLGPTPELGALRRIDVDELVMGKTSGASVTVATPRPWPSGAKRRVVDPGRQARARVTARGGIPVRLDLEVASAFVGGGRADVVVLVKETRPDQELVSELPVTAQLRTGAHVLCTRTRLIAGTTPYPALLVGCTTGQVDELTVELGVGSATIPLNARLDAGD
jgi:hypothetical protein